MKRPQAVLADDSPARRGAMHLLTRHALSAGTGAGRAIPAEPSPAPLRYDDTVLLNPGQPRLVQIASIVCVLAEGDYTRVFTTAGQLGLILRPLKEWQRVLPERHFRRIHRSTLVNCDQVVRIEPCSSGSYRVYLRDLDRPLTMSRRQASAFRSRFALMPGRRPTQ